MKNTLPDISGDSYSGKLKLALLRSSYAREIKQFLYDLVNCELADDAFVTLKEKYKSIATCDSNFADIGNNEITARWKDLLSCTNRENKIPNIKDAVENYSIIYSNTNDIEYLVRSLILVRKVKSAFKDKLQGLCEFVIAEIKSNKSSFQRLSLAKACFYLDQQKCGSELNFFFLEKLEFSLVQNNSSDAKNYIKSLYELKYYSNEEYKIQLALCLEAEADADVAAKVANTYYPTILTRYTESLRTLKSINVAPEIRQRIEAKIKREQLLYPEMLLKIGVEFNADIDIRKLIQDQKIEDFESAYNALISIPILDAGKIDSNANNTKHSSFSRFFNDYVHIGPKGTVTGITDEQNYQSNLNRELFRNTMISIIREIKLVMDLQTKVSKTSVCQLVEQAESKFIPNGRIPLFIEGLYQGFNNNFILASHILVPQIENSLKSVIEQNGRNTTRLADYIQNDNTLGGILMVEKSDKMLNGICNENLLFELNSFLIDGNSVNFRNQICHGLIEPFTVNYYGIYLWWLTLKIVLQTEELFKFNSNT